MPLVITNPTNVPPGGSFVARHPDSGVEFRHHTVEGVFNKFNSHCRANNYPEVSMRDVELSICEHTRANICQESESPTFGQMIVNVFHEAVEWAKAGFPASKAAVDARLPICSTCPYWRGATGGSYFSVACGKCGCSGLKLAIHTSTCPDSPPRWTQFSS